MAGADLYPATPRSTPANWSCAARQSCLVRYSPQRCWSLRAMRDDREGVEDAGEVITVEAVEAEWSTGQALVARDVVLIFLNRL